MLTFAYMVGGWLGVARCVRNQKNHKKYKIYQCSEKCCTNLQFFPIFFENKPQMFKVDLLFMISPRVSVQGVVSLGGHFETLCWEFDFYEVKKNIYYHFSKRKRKYFYTFNHLYSEKSSRAKQLKSTTMTPNLPE